MSDESKPKAPRPSFDDPSTPRLPKFTPLNPPRPLGPVNRKLAEHEAKRQSDNAIEVARRQSDHEFATRETINAAMGYLKGRETIDRDVACLCVGIADAVGITQVPPTLRAIASHMPPPLPKQEKPLHEETKQASRRTNKVGYAALALATIETVRTLIEHADGIAKIFGVHS